ncbi:MAG: hypothetical protein J7500_11540 [Sphingomonas sp.]|uniref:hypothetical protein n=1 Tax=Sphingomonas sp. TaxID=28214 RepID=UPI001B1154D1|nr:hypothetical protein [Sphingomonas sp.]MBO9623333.1 hypothetical protein [Sphingomonas sp.]
MTGADRAAGARRSMGKEIAIRLCGVASLVLCAFAARTLHRLVHPPPPHQATLSELLLGAATFLTFVGGLALLIEGGGLFERIAVPQRNRFTGF